MSGYNEILHWNMKGSAFLLRSKRARAFFLCLTENLTEAGKLLPVTINIAFLDFPSS